MAILNHLRNIKHKAGLTLKYSNKPLIVSAGMPRSGSTLLFNLLKNILLVKYPDRLSYGWIGDVKNLAKGDAYLIKTHGLDSYYCLRSQFKFYTYRDVRVAAVSAIRKFDIEPNIETVRGHIEQYNVAKENCDMIIKYEDLIANPLKYTKHITETLGITADQQELVDRCFNLQPPKEKTDGNSYSRETLLHKEHFTHTKDDEWRSVLPKELQKQINTEFAWWFEECGYPIE